MARLLGSHPLDCCRICSSCLEMSAARYEGAQILIDDQDRIVEARLYTCGTCKTTFAADYEPRPLATEDDVLRVTDLREWFRQRRIAMAVAGAMP